MLVLGNFVAVLMPQGFSTCLTNTKVFFEVRWVAVMRELWAAFRQHDV